MAAGKEINGCRFEPCNVSIGPGTGYFGVSERDAWIRYSDPRGMAANGETGLYPVLEHPRQT